LSAVVRAASVTWAGVHCRLEHDVEVTLKVTPSATGLAEFAVMNHVAGRTGAALVESAARRCLYRPPVPCQF